MRLVTNPSYKHSKEIINKFNSLKDRIFYKDHSVFDKNKILFIIKMVDLCKTYGLNSDCTKWIMKQVVDLNLQEKVIVEDYIPVLLAYQKYKDNGLNSLFSYVSVVELTYAIQEVAGEKTTVISHDEFGIIDECDGWLLTMPFTVEASCSLGRNTVWCTAREDDDNQFTNYIYDGYILFYANKIGEDSKKNSRAKISIAYRDGVFVEGTSEISATVDAENNPLKERDLESIFEKELWYRFRNKIEDKLKIINNIHPLMRKIYDISTNIDLFANANDDLRKQAISYGLSYEPAVFMFHILEDEELSSERSYMIDRLIKNVRSNEFIEEYSFNGRLPISIISLFLVNRHISNETSIKIISFILNRLESGESLDLFMYNYVYLYIFSRKLPDSFYDRFFSILGEEIIEFIFMGSYVPESFRIKYLSSLDLSRIRKIKDIDMIKNIHKYLGIDIRNPLHFNYVDETLSNIYLISELPPDVDVYLISLAPRDKFIRIVAGTTKNNETLNYILDNFPSEKNIMEISKNENINKETSKRILNEFDFSTEIKVRIISKMIESNAIDKDIYKKYHDDMMRTTSIHYSEKVAYFIFDKEKDPIKKFLFAYVSNLHRAGFTKSEAERIIKDKECKDLIISVPFASISLNILKYVHNFLNENEIYFIIKSYFGNLYSYEDKPYFLINYQNILKSFLKNNLLKIREVSLGAFFSYARDITIYDSDIISYIMRYKPEILSEQVFYFTKLDESGIIKILRNLDILFFGSKKNKIDISNIFQSENFKPSHLIEIKKSTRSNINFSFDFSIYLLKQKEKKDFRNIVETVIRYFFTNNNVIYKDIEKMYFSDDSKMLELLEMSKSKNIKDMLIVASDKRITKEMIDNLKKSRNKQVLDALLDNPEILLSDLL